MVSFRQLKSASVARKSFLRALARDKSGDDSCSYCWHCTRHFESARQEPEGQTGHSPFFPRRKRTLRPRCNFSPWGTRHPGWAALGWDEFRSVLLGSTEVDLALDSDDLTGLNGFYLCEAGGEVMHQIFEAVGLCAEDDDRDGSPT